MSADQLMVSVGQSVTLTCNVTRGNPMSYTYTWTHVDTSQTLSGETSNTLMLTDIMLDMGGTYMCEVMNAGGVGTDNVTIEVGGQSDTDFSLL